MSKENDPKNDKKLMVRRGACPFCKRHLRILVCDCKSGSKRRCPCKAACLLEYRVKQGMEFLAEVEEKMDFWVEYVEDKSKFMVFKTPDKLKFVVEEIPDKPEFSVLETSSSGRHFKVWH